MILRIFAVSVAALAAGSFIERARAGQFFVCDNGTAIEIELSRLEQAKRTIPCVAKHYGVEIQPKPTHEAQPKPKAVFSDAKSDETHVPQRHHARPNAASTKVVLPVRKPELPRLRETDTIPAPRLHHGSRLIADVANPDTTRVHIINAGPGGDKWFHVKR